jgi:phage terminase large subunit-like protein
MTKKDELKELEIVAAKIGMQCYDSFYFFFLTFWDCMSGEPFKDAPHIKYICDELQHWGLKVANRERIMKTICISVPPGSSKSTIVTIAFTDWLWLHNPTLSTMNISYSATLSQQHSFKARSITDSQKWSILFDNIFRVLHGKPLEIVKQNQAEMLNNFKGNRYCTSVGGTALGMHSDIFCKDDLISAEQVNSDVEREKANRWNDETTSSRRKVPDCYLDIYISQRLHEDDSIGHVLNKNLDITYICLPAEITEVNKHTVSPPEAISLYTNGILDPNRRPKEVLDVLREEMGATGYAGQYLQVPFNLEDQPIKPSMFKIISKRDDMIFDLFIDGAYTTNTENDPTGLLITGYKDKQLYVKKAYNRFMTLPQLVSFIKELGDNGEFDIERGRIFVEPKASGISLVQYLLTETNYNAVLIGENDKRERKLVQEGKTSRHNLVQPKADAGRISLFKDDWNDTFIHQLSGFPRVLHDEFVDLTGYAINHYFFKESKFIADWALSRLAKLVIGSINVNLTSQEIIARNGNVKNYSVTWEDNDKGDTQMFEYPDTHYHYRYIVVVVTKSESERNGTSTIMVYDRMSKVVSCMYDQDMNNPRRIAKKAVELSWLYDKAKLVVANKKVVGSAQNEELDISHSVLTEIRKIGYDKLHSRLTINDIKKKREREFGFEVNRSTSREIFIHLKDEVETNKIGQLPLEVYNDISILERKKDTGEIDFQDGHEGNRGLAYSIALKVDDEMSDAIIIKNNERDSW